MAAALTASSDGPVFIVGAPRSGTTMMRLILNAHSAVAIPSETSYFPHLYDRRATTSWRDAVDAFVGDCERRFRPRIDLRGVAAHLRHAEPDYSLLLALPIIRWAESEKKRRWGEKTPEHIFHVDAIMTLFPHAKIVAVQRDPRDVVASMNRFPMAGNDTVLNARLWCDVWTRGYDLVTTVVPPTQRMLVFYESLLDSSQQTIQEVCDFLGLAFEPGMLSFGDTATDYADVVRSPKIEQSIQGIQQGWRKSLSARDIAMVERVCRAPMLAFGYEPTELEMKLADRIRVAAKLTYVNLKQMQHHEQRYHRVTYRPFSRLQQRDSES